MLSCSFWSSFSVCEMQQQLFPPGESVCRGFSSRVILLLLPHCLFIFSLINREHERNSWDKRKSHIYREYMVGHTCFFHAMVCVTMHEKCFVFSFKSINGCRCILNVILMQKAKELLEIYFICSTQAECVRHSFVLSIMCMRFECLCQTRIAWDLVGLNVVFHLKYIICKHHRYP